ncbi:MAG: methionyl-tRNA formyltransferase [Veillonellaceae bacterium]|nr:methionyl-tRNA formyltransferase [Veillonellaceae bacterium]
MSKLKTIFMGTPDFAVPCLEVLQAKTEVLAVITQPDRPKGRGHNLQASPVKQKALEYNLPVLQPEKIKTEEFTAELERLQPDLIVVVAFGQILSQRILDIPPLGCVNVHASLLPRYRGAAPIHWSIINGEKETGVTTMLMDAGLDTGDMLLKDKVTITEEMTTEELHDQLMAMGGKLLAETIDGLANGTITPEKQDDSISNYAGMLNKETGHIDWSKSAVEIHNLIRGLNSWPVAWSMKDGKNYKFWRTKVENRNSDKAPGTVVELRKNSFCLATGEGLLEVLEIQPPSKKRMSAGDLLRGHGVAVGDIFN